MLTKKEYCDFELLINKLKDHKNCSGTFLFTEKQFKDTKDAYTYAVVKLVSKYLECENPYEICEKVWCEIDKNYLHNDILRDITVAAFFLQKYGNIIISSFHTMYTPITAGPINTFVIRYGCILLYKDMVTNEFVNLGKSQISKDDDTESKTQKKK